MDDNDFAKYFPTSFGKSTSSSKSKAKPEPRKDPAGDDGIDAFRAYLPMSFGKKKAPKGDKTAQYEKTKRSMDQDNNIMQPAIESSSKQSQSKKDRSSSKTDSDDDSDDHDSDDDHDSGSDNATDNTADTPSSSVLPISHEIVLDEHSKTISAMALDPAGTRLVTGGYDFNVCFWDFAGMDTRFKPFRSMEPCGAHQIHELKYSLTGDKILIISGEAKARIYDRNGVEVAEYQKGDPYIRDMRLTSGHISALTSGAWHPYTKDKFITSSTDGTIRLWDVENIRKQTDVIAYKTKERGGRTPVTSIAYSSDGRMIAGAGADGTLSLYPSTGPFLRSIHTIENAHVKGTETSSIVFSRDSQRMVTRGGDDTVKLWDTRNLKHPLSIAEDLVTLNSEANVIFSPDEQLILTGTGVKKNEGYGKIVMMNSENLEVVRTVHVSQSSVVRVLWHDKLNQIIAGSADGTARVFYDPEEDKVRSNKRKQEKMRTDPVASRRPEMPLTGPGKGGKVGTNLTQHVLTEIVKDTTREEDPRAALLKYAEMTEKDPQWITPAYKKNQPKAVYDNRVDEEYRELKRKK
ncbi:hypothetical protein BG011_004843 [Mortierella polycephala]|uniref:WD40 repeat-like protein n=1 Tax=Mortierella polycephala TaxID=41804 RepID=A0A9P6U258_9FUNG|nr:hypothetical protein BG011_004843 [Mortierella polycephala]